MVKCTSWGGVKEKGESLLKKSGNWTHRFVPATIVDRDKNVIAVQQEEERRPKDNFNHFNS